MNDSVDLPAEQQARLRATIEEGEHTPYQAITGAALRGKSAEVLYLSQFARDSLIGSLLLQDRISMTHLRLLFECPCSGLDIVTGLIGQVTSDTGSVLHMNRKYGIAPIAFTTGIGGAEAVERYSQNMKEKLLFALDWLCENQALLHASERGYWHPAEEIKKGQLTFEIKEMLEMVLKDPGESMQAFDRFLSSCVEPEHAHYHEFIRTVFKGEQLDSLYRDSSAVLEICRKWSLDFARLARTHVHVHHVRQISLIDEASASGSAKSFLDAWRDDLVDVLCTKMQTPCLVMGQRLGIRQNTEGAIESALHLSHIMLRAEDSEERKRFVNARIMAATMFIGSGGLQYEAQEQKQRLLSHFGPSTDWEAAFSFGGDAMAEDFSQHLREVRHFVAALKDSQRASALVSAMDI